MLEILVRMLFNDVSLAAFGPWQIVLVVVVVLLLFGGRKIPELMRGLGSGIKEFKNATKEEEEDEKKSIKDKPKS